MALSGAGGFTRNYPPTFPEANIRWASLRASSESSPTSSQGRRLGARSGASLLRSSWTVCSPGNPVEASRHQPVPSFCQIAIMPSSLTPLLTSRKHADYSAAPKAGSCGGMNLRATVPRAPVRRPGSWDTCAGRYRSRLPHIRCRNARIAARRRTGNGPCRRGGHKDTSEAFMRHQAKRGQIPTAPTATPPTEARVPQMPRSYIGD